MSWNDMIEGEIVGATTAVLAGIGVSKKDFATGEFDARSWSADHIYETNDRGIGEGILRGRNASIVCFQDFGFATKYEHECTAGVADIERFIVLVENENGFIHARNCPW